MPNPRIEPLKKVLDMDPNDDTAWFGLGKAYLDDGSYEQAVQALDKCLEVKPSYSAAYYALAQALEKTGQAERCREVCQKGIEVSKTNGDVMVTTNLEYLVESLG